MPRENSGDLRSGNWRSTETWLADTGWMRALALALTRDAAAADDVVQDALVALERDTRERSRPQVAWLVRSLASRWGRTRARATRREREAARDEALPATDELVARLEIQRVVAEELAALAEPHRTTLLLRYHESLDAAHIARVQGVEPAAVRKRIERGLAELRERLDQRFGGRRTEWMSLLAPWMPATKSVVTSAAVVGTGGLLVKLVLSLAAAAILGVAFVYFATHDEPALTNVAAQETRAATDLESDVARTRDGADDTADATSTRAAFVTTQSAANPAAAQTETPPVITDVEVLVVDVAERPVAGAHVELRSTRKAKARAPEPAALSTGAPLDPPLPAPEHALTNALGVVTFHPAEAREALAVSAALDGYGTSGEQALRLALQRGVPRVTLMLQPRASFVVEVVDGEQRPISGAVVHAETRGSLIGSPMPRPLSDLTTDASGRVTFEFDASPVSWRVNATFGGQRSVDESYRLKSGTPGLVRLAIEPPFHVSGHVVDAAGRAVGGASVQLLSTAGDTEGIRVSLSTQASALGEFAFDLASGGEYSLGASANLAITTQPAVVNLSSAARDAQVVLALAATTTIRGTIAWDDGRPVSGVRLAAFMTGDANTPEQRMLAYLERTKARVELDEDGHFRVDGVAPSFPYSIRATDGPPRHDRFVLVENIAPGTDDVRIVLSERALRKGFVHLSATDTLTREPLSVYWVKLFRRDVDGWVPVGVSTEQTDVCGLTPGATYAVWGSGGAAWTSAPIAFVADDLHGSEIELLGHAPNELLVNLRDGQGPATGGIRAYVNFADLDLDCTDAIANAYTGRAAFRGLAPARYRVVAEIDNKIVGEEEVVVSANGPREFELRIHR